MRKEENKIIVLALVGVVGLGGLILSSPRSTFLNQQGRSGAVSQSPSNPPLEVSQGQALTQSPPPVSPPAASKLAAGAAYTLEGKKLYGFGVTKRWPIASLTKLMTALLAKRLFSPGEEIVITPAVVSVEGEAGNLRPGEIFAVEDLIQIMLLTSSNDAAVALADHYGREEFVAAMNSMAEELGMTNTNYVDPAGLSFQNLSTIEDLIKLTRFVWDTEPEIFAITRQPAIKVIDKASGRERKLENINFFAGRKEFLGGKTGYLPQADGNLLSLFRLPNEDSPVVIVVLGAADRFEETEKILKKL